jgi:ATP-dependent Clp protease ATP-binding subunit ClpX
MAWFAKSKDASTDNPQAVQELHCSFCGKSQRVVEKLIAGPEVYICNECVGLCTDIIEEHTVPRVVPGIPDPPPSLAELRQALDAACVGLDHPKQALVAALGLHLARLQPDAPALRPPVLLLVGPRGAGKSHLLRALRDLTPLPSHHADINRLSATGYVGLDVENLLWELVRQSDNDYRLAESGVLALDGLHRIVIAEPALGNKRDVSGESVQRDLLRVVEGMQTDVQGYSPRHPQHHAAPFHCRRLLVVLAASFEGLPTGDRAQRAWLAEQGLLRELLSRVDHIVPVPAPSAFQLRGILTDPERGLLPQRLAALEALGREVRVEEEAVEAMLAWADQEPDGAWALHRPLARMSEDSSAEEPLVVDAAMVACWRGDRR